MISYNMSENCKNILETCLIEYIYRPIIDTIVFVCVKVSVICS